MNKFKTFTVGFIMGGLLIGGASVASNSYWIEVQFPGITYVVDGIEMKSYPDENVPTTIQYKGFNYVPVRFITEALGQDITWDPVKRQILVNEPDHLNYEKVDIEAADVSIKQWVEASRHKEMVQLKTNGQDSYILLTRGTKSTGGYDIEVESVKQHQDGTEIRVHYVDPPKGSLLVEQMTSPYILLKISNQILEQVTVNETNGQFVPHLLGISSLLKIVEETDNLIVFEPVKEDDRWLIHGAARTFEGVLGYSSLDEHGSIIDEGSIVSAGAAPNWSYFEYYLSAEQMERVNELQIYTLNARDGSKHEIVLLSLDTFQNPH